MKLGILGGTFDPVHQGHISIAHQILRLFSLDRVLFMVAKESPHKSGRPISDSFHRYAMTVLALAHETRLVACAWELRRTGKSYTIETLRHFAGGKDLDEVYFIAGSDSLQEIHLWKDYDRLLSEYRFIFVQRPDAEVEVDRLNLADDLRKNIQLVCKKNSILQPGKSFLIHLDPSPLSSTQIRTALRSGHTAATDAVPATVLQYIRKHKLYE